MFEKTLLKTLRLLPPELAHSIGLLCLDLSSNIPIPFIKKSTPHKITAMNIEFSSPVGLAAGFDKNGKHIKGLSTLGFGFLEVGTVTPFPQVGNPKPRLFRIPEQNAIVNRMGFNNDGIDNLIKNIDSINRSLPIGVNIGANKTTREEERINDYLICFEKAYMHANYITINVSSPNTKNLRALQRVLELNNMLERISIRKNTLKSEFKKDVPVVLKIAPDLEESEIKDITHCCLKNGIDGIVATNTTVSRDDLIENVSKESGGLSGPPLLKKSLRVVKSIYKEAKSICIIGCGGIDSIDAALEFKKEGASLIQIYSGLIYKGSRLITEINENWHR